jgi:glycosyltransferase involved in cell wall biosynthesis
MKILHTIDSTGLYGAEIMLLNLMEEQRQMNLSPILLSINDFDSGKSAIEVESIKRGFQTIKIAIKKGFSLKGAMNMARVAQENQISLFHSHGYKVNILLGCLPKFIRKKPVVTTLHGWLGVKRFSRMWFYETVDSLILHRLDAVVQVRTYKGESKELAYRGTRNTYTVNNGIPELVFDPASISHSDPVVNDFCKDGFIIGTICRLSAEKGLDYLIESMRLLLSHKANYKAIIIGEGPQKKILQSKIDNYGLARKVLIAGYRDQAFNYLPLFDVFVLPSLTEGLPITILEAMQANTPIIATRVGGIPDVLGNGAFGIVVEPGNSAALAEAISYVSSNPVKINEMSNDARKAVLEKYSSRRMAEGYLKVYEAVLGK